MVDGQTQATNDPNAAKTGETQKTGDMQTEQPKIKLVKMTRSEEDAKGGPTTADVHPDEVGEYIRGGWRR